MSIAGLFRENDPEYYETVAQAPVKPTVTNQFRAAVRKLIAQRKLTSEQGDRLLSLWEQHLDTVKPEKWLLETQTALKQSKTDFMANNGRLPQLSEPGTFTAIENLYTRIDDAYVPTDEHTQKTMLPQGTVDALVLELTPVIPPEMTSVRAKWAQYTHTQVMETVSLLALGAFLYPDEQRRSSVETLGLAWFKDWGDVNRVNQAICPARVLYVQLMERLFPKQKKHRVDPLDRVAQLVNQLNRRMDNVTQNSLESAFSTRLIAGLLLQLYSNDERNVVDEKDGKYRLDKGKLSGLIVNDNTRRYQNTLYQLMEGELRRQNEFKN